MYKIVYLVLILLFAIISGMIGQRVMDIYMYQHPQEGFSIKGALKSAYATKNKMKRNVSRAIDDKEGFISKKLKGFFR